MTSKSIRRLARDHASLHKAGLPPNYIFHPKAQFAEDFTSLSVYLAGPTFSSYEHGLFHLDLQIPTTYPTTPPTAFFRTKTFHPNVDPTTGAVCVDTLKRDWREDLTLRDVLITIYCLLLDPNPASALNEEAGILVERDYPLFEKRARLWTNMYASIPKGLEAEVEAARQRGEEREDGKKSNPRIKSSPKGKRKKDELQLEEEKPMAVDENESQEPAASMPTSRQVSFNTPVHVPSSQQSILGLGIRTRTDEVSNPRMDMKAPSTTPVTESQESSEQPPAPPLRSRRLRERYSMARQQSSMSHVTPTMPSTARPSAPVFAPTRQTSNPLGLQSVPTAASSFTSAATRIEDTPAYTPQTSFHTAPTQSPEPQAKRVRLSTSPPFSLSTSEGNYLHFQTQTNRTFDLRTPSQKQHTSLNAIYQDPLIAQAEDTEMQDNQDIAPPAEIEFPWLYWNVSEPMSTCDLSTLSPRMPARSDIKARKWKAAGEDVTNHSKGWFGPRRGIYRL